MFKTPYDTTPCADYVLSEIKKELAIASIEGELRVPVTESDLSVRGVMIIPPSVKHVPPFAHPMLVESNSGRSEQLVVDTRGMTRESREGQLSVSSRIDYNLLLLRALLTRQWMDHSPLDLLACGTLPLTVYSRWVSENICRRLPLNPGEQMMVTVVAGWFYLCLFREEAEIDEQLKLKMSSQISRATYVGTDRVLEITDNLDKMNSVLDFIRGLKNVVQNSALEKLSHGLLYTFVGGSWFGANARETVAVALEHPPTFMALVHVALQDRSWRKTGLGTIVLNSDKGDIGKSFTYNLLSLLKA